MDLAFWRRLGPMGYGLVNTVTVHEQNLLSAESRVVQALLPPKAYKPRRIIHICPPFTP